MSSDSTAESSTVNTYGIRGFPASCVCGTKTTIYTSETNKNPGRPFFRCLTRRKVASYLLDYIVVVYSN
ncbi:hypothetical protein YC2023_085722 [Brassica napus]|uniref:Uncharacterized protein n=1 Tax=Brassica oleracea var. oleracea TaxID=109376 RepID=A0A0D2ZV19_BRAOL